MLTWYTVRIVPISQKYYWTRLRNFRSVSGVHLKKDGTAPSFKVKNRAKIFPSSKEDFQQTYTLHTFGLAKMHLNYRAHQKIVHKSQFQSSLKIDFLHTKMWKKSQEFFKAFSALLWPFPHDKMLQLSLQSWYNVPN